MNRSKIFPTQKQERRIRHIAGKLMEGVGWAADKVAKAIEYLGREIDKLGKAVTGP